MLELLSTARRRGRRETAIASALVAALVAGTAAAASQAAKPASGAWFGLTLPPPMGAAPAVIVGTRGPRPVAVPPGDPTGAELNANTIRADLDTIVGFSRESRATKEIGGGQQWGRIAGFPSGAKTVAWAVEQFRKAGIADLKTQPFAQDPKSSFWLPLSWELRLLGDSLKTESRTRLTAENGVAVIPGRRPGEAVIVNAHVDAWFD
ncbi:MAG: hypothetical protein AB7H81_14555, partial [Vicinamibacterales bacterium]